MFRFLATTQADGPGPLRCRPRSPRPLVHSVATLTISLCAAILAPSLWAPPLQAESVDRPNIIVILTDDQGWGDLSLHGNPNLHTPNMDSLARDGARIENFYVCAVCSPTRAEFLTGRYHTRMGVYSTSQGGERFDLAERTIGDVFGAAGYHTAAYGKWHSGMQPPYHPNARGFQDFYGFCSGHWGNYFSPLLEHNGEIVQGSGFLTNDLTDRAIEFVQSQHDQDSPFFLYLPLNTPHSPMQVPEQDWRGFADKEIVPDAAAENAARQNLLHTRAALALCENIDGNVGRLLQTLESLEIADNTIVVFFCDNGPNGYRFNGGMRGVKGSVHEGGLRSPCFIRWPGQIQPGTEIRSIAAAIDLLPTLSELAGVPIGSTAGPLDGISLAGHLLATGEVPSERLIFTSWRNNKSVRSQDFRYHLNGTLYDIGRDRGEQTDVASEHPAVAQELKSQLQEWINETATSEQTQATAPSFPVGHPHYAHTQLPIRDATSTGQIKRSSRHPNSTFFSNWINAEDVIEWKVDVLAAGEFDVAMWYACEDSAVGTQLSLAFQADSGETQDPLVTVVQHSNPSGFVAAEQDRAPRTEGFEKDWKPIQLGRLRLPEGAGTLRLTANEIQGDRGIEVRLLLLTRDPS